MKDNFSIQSDSYSLYRPTYPIELAEYLSSLCTQQNSVWDCGTGNGQLAVGLSNFFRKVVATDLSKKQVANAIQKSNIIYKVETAENPAFENDTFDLITVAQALHWFNFDKFYFEVKRTIKSKGIFAAVGYSLLKINPDVDEIINHFYSNVIGKYWDVERNLVDKEYKTIPFPFDEVKIDKTFAIKNYWTIENLKGYLDSWSGVQNFIKDNSYNPVSDIIKEIEKIIPDSSNFETEFPIFIRAGIVEK